MAWSFKTAVEKVTKWTAPEVNNLEEGVEEAKTAATAAQSTASTAKTYGEEGKTKAGEAKTKAEEALLVTVSNTETASFTLKAAQASTCVECNSSSKIEATIPKTGFSAGEIVELCKKGTGEVEVKGESGFTLRNPSTAKLRAQWSTASIRFLSATEGVLSGDLE